LLAALMPALKPTLNATTTTARNQAMRFMVDLLIQIAVVPTNAHAFTYTIASLKSVIRVQT